MYIRRKVYSDVNFVENDNNVYENEVKEPRYYSVIMSEDELDLFSDLQEYLYSEDDSKTAAAVLGGLGAATALGAGGYGAYKANQALAEEGGLKGVAKKHLEARKAANEAYAKQAKADAETVKNLAPKSKGGKALTGAAKSNVVNKTEKELAAARKAVREEARGTANKATKESLKKGWEVIKGNKKLRYAALGAGALGVGAAGVGIGGKLKNKD